MLVCDTHVQVPVAVVVSGGVSPAVAALPAVGVLLRLTIACYLQLPLTSVLITGAVSTDPASVPVLVAPSDTVNSQPGFCEQLTTAGSGGSGRRALPVLRVEPPRHLQPAASTRTTVSLAVLSCVGPDSDGGVPASLQARLDSLAGGGGNASATRPPGSTPAATPPPQSIFRPFASAAAAASSLSASDVTVAAPAVGRATPRATPSPPVASGAFGAASASTGSGVSVAVVGAAAAGGAALFTLAIALFFVYARRRRWCPGQQRRPLKAEAPRDGPGSVPSGLPVAGVSSDDSILVGVNRMYGSAGALGDVNAPSESEAAVAGFKAARIAAASANAAAPGVLLGGGTRSTGTGSPALSRRTVVVKTVFGPLSSKDADTIGAVNPLRSGSRRDLGRRPTARESESPRPASALGEESGAASIRVEVMNPMCDSTSARGASVSSRACNSNLVVKASNGEFSGENPLHGSLQS